MFKIIIHKRIVNAYNDSLHKFLCVYISYLFFFVDTNTKSPFFANFSKSFQISQFKTLFFLITKNILVLNCKLKQY